MKILGLVITTQATLNSDAIKIHQNALHQGKELGILTTLRFNQQTLSEAKFKESARFFNFEALNSKYPPTPLDPNNEKISSITPRRIQGPTQENVTPQSSGTASSQNQK